MRKITKIILHCSATPEGRDFSVADIDSWHRAQGYDCIGYHYVIARDGRVFPGRPLDRIGAHCKGHNANSIGICYIGGCAADGKTPKDTRTPEQRSSMRLLVDNLLAQFPGASVHCHNEFARKACPSFKICDL
ncbi:MAG: N-acetylmuramoyl-L-alanine amidase [Allobaculum sp.]|nr:N-acetylmuramoyl-L-alanine amidase [Allobaculum sp.]